jgi:predicted HicB family RNase H-like nuclease
MKSARYAMRAPFTISRHSAGKGRMMETMTYKDYAARIEYSDEDACFVGHIAGIRDVVGFHGDSVVELKTAFESAVDDYLACLGRNSEQKKFI